MKATKLIGSLAILWGVLFLLSFIAPRFMEATGDGFTRGLNRVGSFFMWQAGAFVTAGVLFLVARTTIQKSGIKRWLFFMPLLIHLLMVLLLIIVFLVARFGKLPVGENPPSSTPTRPVSAAAEPIPASPVESTSVPVTDPQVETFMGIYRSGFEMSHFYTMDGRGPWWLEAKDEAFGNLQSFYVERPGRAGGITVAITLQGYLEDAGEDLAAVGSFDHRLQVVSIESIRGLDLEEFEQVLQAVQSR